MRLLVRMTLPSFKVGIRWKQNYEHFECIVARLRGPVKSTKGVPDYITADVQLPEKYRHLAMERLFNADGTYPVEALLNFNAKTLAPFLASGDLEWDVREQIS